MARKYTVVFEGETFTRQTDRVYTHVIMVRDTRTERHANWGPLTWCGRPDLTMKALSKARNSGQWTEVHVVELSQP